MILNNRYALYVSDWRFRHNGLRCSASCMNGFLVMLVLLLSPVSCLHTSPRSRLLTRDARRKTCPPAPSVTPDEPAPTPGTAGSRWHGVWQPVAFRLECGLLTWAVSPGLCVRSCKFPEWSGHLWVAQWCCGSRRFESLPPAHHVWRLHVLPVWSLVCLGCSGFQMSKCVYTAVCWFPVPGCSLSSLCDRLLTPVILRRTSSNRKCVNGPI